MAIALSCALVLSGCSGLASKAALAAPHAPQSLFALPELPDLPFDLPELPAFPDLPFDLPDLSSLPNPFAAFGVNTSVDEARAAKAHEQASTLTAEDLVQAGLLTVGLQTKQVSAPFIVTGSGAGLYGIDIDFASAVADKLGLAVRFVEVDEVDNPLATGVCDVVFDAAPSRVKTATIVGGYYETGIAFFSKEAAHVATIDELQGKTVALQDGSVSQGALNRTTLEMEQRPYANLNESFEALVAGEVDYVLCDAYPGAYLAAAYDGASFAGLLTAPTTVGIAAPTDKSQLQLALKEAIAAVSDGGSMDIIRSVWIAGMPALTEADVIADVPIRKDAPPLDEWGEVQDGTNAGSNAVVITQSMVDEYNARVAAEEAAAAAEEAAANASYSDDYAYTDESYETYDDGSNEVSTDEGTEDYTEYYTDGE